MYAVSVKRLQILIDEDLDEALQLEAARLGRSKASLIRDWVRERLGGGKRRDPLDALVGDLDAEPVDDIDEVIYGR
jgi:plasmid stability protein